VLQAKANARKATKRQRQKRRGQTPRATKPQRRCTRQANLHTLWMRRWAGVNDGRPEHTRPNALAIDKAKAPASVGRMNLASDASRAVVSAVPDHNLEVPDRELQRPDTTKAAQRESSNFPANDTK
jgi:hypothetical protein